jgi:hypothetical protein
MRACFPRKANAACAAGFHTSKKTFNSKCTYIHKDDSGETDSGALANARQNEHKH